MKTKVLIVTAAALCGGLLSVSAAPTADVACTEVSASHKTGVPVPIKIVPPTELPRSSMGTTVKVLLTIDAAGRPHGIRISSKDRRLTASLVAAISQWEFAPATKNGTPVSAKVELPVQLIGS